MSMPLSLSDEEADVLHRLAAPITYGRRDEFLQALTAALISCPQPGPGLVYPTAREIQRSFTLSAQRETAIAAVPRHLAARTAPSAVPSERSADSCRSGSVQV
jgi:hypothetical protein